jgi:hypothetical protein
LKNNQGKQSMLTPDYLALDKDGFEITRKALCIGELPLGERSAALKEATETIALAIGLVPVETIHFGAPVFSVFQDLNRADATRHVKSKLLLGIGDYVPLSFCPSYH